MSLHFDKNGAPLGTTTYTPVSSVISPKRRSTPLTHSSSSPSTPFPSSTASAPPAASPNKLQPPTYQRAVTSEDTYPTLTPSDSASSLLGAKSSSVPSSSLASATAAEALDQSINFLQMIMEQLTIKKDVDPQALQREVGHVVKLLTTARSASSNSATDFQRRLKLDLRERAMNNNENEADEEVIEWITTQYNAPLPLDQESLASIRPFESETAHNFRSTMLCMRWVRKVREHVHRRALANSQFESIRKLHLSDPIKTVLAKVDDWDFDLFALEKLAGRRVLSVLAYHVLEDRLGYFTLFGIKPAFFSNFISAIEDGYNNVPYHSHIHAADVMHNTYFFLTRPNMKAKITHLDLFGGVIAAAIHDYRHNGVNNAFHVATGSDVALRYNDRAVLESMHVSEAFLLLKKLHHNIFSGLKANEKTEIRQIIIAMVLATDMSNHFKNLAEFKSQIELHKTKEQEWSPNSPQDRLMCCETALHCADLGNPCKPLKIYLEWTKRVMEEFYRQGDEERKLGLPISAMMDRTKPSVERSQIGFIDFIVKPLFEVYVQLNPEVDCCLTEVGKNRTYFQDLVAKLPIVPPTPKPNRQTLTMSPIAASSRGSIISTTNTNAALQAALAAASPGVRGGLLTNGQRSRGSIISTGLPRGSIIATGVNK